MHLPRARVNREMSEAIDIIAELVGDEALIGINPIVMTDYATRRAFQELIRIENPELRVYSWQEMLPAKEVEIFGTIQA